MKLLTTHTEGKLKIRVKHFVEDKSKNLMPIAIGIRHLTAHGILSAGGAELNLVSNRKLLDALSELLLEYSDDLHSQMTQKLDEHVELALSM